MGKKSVYDIVSERILEQLERGQVPWRKPWKSVGGFPKNFVTNKEYKGVNVFLLSGQYFEYPYFLTYNQAKKMGAQVRKGEKGFPVVFWKIIDGEDNEGNEKKFPLLRYYTVFNVSQVDGIPEDKLEKINQIEEFEEIKCCEELVENWNDKPTINHDTNQAMYIPSDDIVRMPRKESFKSEEEYYSTLFHELTHSTMHKSRLNRKDDGDEYGFEELVAEMGAAFLCGHCQIDNERTIKNTGAYINGWMKKIRENVKILVQAGSKARKSTEYILNGLKEKE